jgi:hypothetical protein
VELILGYIGAISESSQLSCCEMISNVQTNCDVSAMVQLLEIPNPMEKTTATTCQRSERIQLHDFHPPIISQPDIECEPLPL